MYLFSVAIVTNYHKFNGLKQWKFIILPFWRLEVQNEPHVGLKWFKIKVLAGLGFLWRLKEKNPLACFL